MKDLTFNEWQENLSKQLELNYKKLNLIRNEKLYKISRRESGGLRGIQEVRVSANK
jgi:hypothetical protein